MSARDLPVFIIIIIIIILVSIQHAKNVKMTGWYGQNPFIIFSYSERPYAYHVRASSCTSTVLWCPLDSTIIQVLHARRLSQLAGYIGVPCLILQITTLNLVQLVPISGGCLIIYECLLELQEVRTYSIQVAIVSGETPPCLGSCQLSRVLSLFLPLGRERCIAIPQKRSKPSGCVVSAGSPILGQPV